MASSVTMTTVSSTNGMPSPSFVWHRTNGHHPLPRNSSHGNGAGTGPIVSVVSDDESTFTEHCHSFSSSSKVNTVLSLSLFLSLSLSLSLFLSLSLSLSPSNYVISALLHTYKFSPRIFSPFSFSHFKKCLVVVVYGSQSASRSTSAPFVVNTNWYRGCRSVFLSLRWRDLSLFLPFLRDKR